MSVHSSSLQSDRHPSTDAESFSEIKMSEEFYFESIIFQVESQLYKVPKHHFLVESPVFRDMLSLPIPEGQEVEGSSKERPIILEEVKTIELRSLLKVMFPPPFVKTSLGVDEWEGVIKLTDMWGMARMKEHAARELAALLSEDPISRVVFGRRYKLKDWLIPAYNELIWREKPLDLRDLKMLGPGTTLQICALRERICPKDCVHCGSSLTKGRRQDLLRSHYTVQASDFGMYFDVDEGRTGQTLAAVANDIVPRLELTEYYNGKCHVSFA
ncbi:hypothetical protein CC1G_04676 [Coprinopsis cinerea okayama7|uniref:BTB domain-containing protein n=1 Tax=Coprinopsis cinerea (strain Okayama-7 / 130 / ATCC MYA-4618 / FGSC 9003) TaxID=240176 RepID=A8N4X6_COPC7|nr:hypothetical protein CC1G_04676 [Coprinopsis cinerea okayama7\|eukprot:XP_001829987.2 hypothetical protein CC1G_04676 [Coprinopsis cinerea okayama7\